ncbi:hypothetical protein F5144DRAFT_193833 [Chaetomium tenue]|uniref:Uncharacterized protein n=1 Tax=Chaetomium tenue TaxID=1854479 RepID=A0ACB7PEL9_9PEZI|nr:hypothetical protein F5144DRAFT_193833 [Chaetomium globosum]
MYNKDLSHFQVHPGPCDVWWGRICASLTFSCSLPTNWLRIGNLLPHLAMWSSVRLLRTSSVEATYPLACYLTISLGQATCVARNLPRRPSSSSPPPPPKKLAELLNPCVFHNRARGNAHPFTLGIHFPTPPTAWSETASKCDMSGGNNTRPSDFSLLRRGATCRLVPSPLGDIPGTKCNTIRMRSSGALCSLYNWAGFVAASDSPAATHGRCVAASSIRRSA